MRFVWYVSVGKPVTVEKCEKPDEDLINSYHAKYLEALGKTFDEHKANYGVAEDVHLNFIWFIRV